MEFQFRRRYSLPPNDPRFLALTATEILTDWWAHRITEDPEAANEIEMDQEDYEAEAARMLQESIENDPTIPTGATQDEFETVVEQHYGGPEP